MALVAATPNREFRLSAVPSEQALDLVTRRLGHASEAALHALTALDRVVFAEGYAESGALEVMARGSAVRGWLGIFNVEVAPTARLRGLGSAVIGALARWARSEAATRAFLQVDDANEVALTMYGRLGFVGHHSYRRYRLMTNLPDPAASSRAREH